VAREPDPDELIDRWTLVGDEPQTSGTWVKAVAEVPARILILSVMEWGRWGPGAGAGARHSSDLEAQSRVDHDADRSVGVRDLLAAAASASSDLITFGNKSIPEMPRHGHVPQPIPEV
jgi:hypothetical protein